MGELNNFHKRSVAIGFQDIHQRLAALEEGMASCDRPSPLSEYIQDLSPTEMKVVQDHFSRVRSTMLDCLAQYQIPLENRHVSLRWMLQTGLACVGIAVDELGPEHLRGYGALDSEAKAILRKIQQELNRCVDRLSAYVRQGAGQDLAERLERLQTQPVHVAALGKLNRVVLRWKLVEFQPILQTIVRRLEVPQFEIAVFGRVNSGKSSLLNHLVDMDVLPVGVTPITAVPTRLTHGGQPSAVIRFAEAPPCRVDVAQLHEYASEEGNPGNAKHVTGIEVELTSPCLHEGVVLVDTPGVGSLASAGSAETYAYLPRCDLSIVLVDAASTLSQEDLMLVRLLYEAGITVHVLLSKADLLNSGDRQHALAYIRQQLQRNLGVEPPVHAVSAIGADTVLLDTWFDDELKPLLARHHELVEASLRRKICHLRESVIAVLQTMRNRRHAKRSANCAPGDLLQLQHLLQEADASIHRAQASAREIVVGSDSQISALVQQAAEALADTRYERSEPEDDQLPQIVREYLARENSAAHAALMQLQRTLASTLERMEATASLASLDRELVRDFTAQSLPEADLSLLANGSMEHVPWWAIWSDKIAVWALQRIVERQNGVGVQETVRLHQSRLRAWFKQAIDQLVDAYESQAEIVRQQMRRATSAAEHADQGETHGVQA